MRFRILPLAIVSGILFTLVAVGIALGNPARANLTPDERKTVEEVRAYLEDIETLRSRFRQIDDAGRVAVGTIYVHRPWRVRVEYDEPSPILIVSSGRNLIYYDRELESATNISQRRTPAWFLLAPEVELDGRILVSDVRREGGRIEIEARRADEPLEGMLVMVLTEEPMQLVAWEIVDATGERTRVELDDPVMDEPILDVYFQFIPPVGSGRIDGN